MSASATLLVVPFALRAAVALATSFLCGPGGQGFVVKYKHRNQASAVEYLDRPDVRTLHSPRADKDSRYPS